MKRFRFCTALTTFLVAVWIGGPSAQATLVTWQNDGTDFNDPASWGVETFPAVAELRFDAAAAAQPVLTADIDVQSIQFNSNIASGYTISGGDYTLGLFSADPIANGTGGTPNITVFDVAINLKATGVVTIGGNGTHTYNKTISGADITELRFTQSSQGIVILNAANSYTGSTTLTGQGNFVLGNKAAFSTGSVNISATAKLSANKDLTGANKVTNAINLSSNVTFSDGSALELGGDIDLGGAARTILNNNTGGTILSGTISNDDGQGITFDTGASSGSMLSLTKANSYTGATTIVGNGTVAVSAMDNLGASNALVLGISSSTRTPTLKYTGAGETSALSITLAGNNNASSVLDASGTGLLKLTGGLNVINGNNQRLFLRGSGAGEISGLSDGSGGQTLRVSKEESGIWTISGTNTYTGATAVSAGTLLIANGASLGNTSVTVDGSGILGGRGTIAGNTVINSGGTLSPGESPGSLTFEGNLTFNSGSALLFEAGDLAIVEGTLDFNNGWTLSLAGSDATFAEGGQIVLFEYGTLAPSPNLTPTFDLSQLIGLNIAPGDLSLINDSVNKQIILNGISVIPEPGSVTLILSGGVLTLLGLRRFRAI